MKVELFCYDRFFQSFNKLSFISYHHYVIIGPEECFEKTKTIASEKPEEECTLEPRVECKHVTKLVPQLKPTEQCVDVPKEVCTLYIYNKI